MEPANRLAVTTTTTTTTVTMIEKEPNKSNHRNAATITTTPAAIGQQLRQQASNGGGGGGLGAGINNFKNNYDISDIKPTKKRYLILLLFCLHSMINAAQWIYLSSITSTVTEFFGVDNMAVNWTSMIFMLVYIPLVVPATWLFEQIGMRNSILLGSLGTSLGSLIKCFSCQPSRFHLVMVGQSIVAVSQLFVLSVPPRLASVWFPDHQVALANACGVFGNQLGIALGFVVPQLVLGASALRAGGTGATQQGLFNLFIGVATLSCLITLLLALLFDESPKKAPGLARLQQIKQEQIAMAEQSGTMPLVGDDDSLKTAKTRSGGFASLLWVLFTDKNFVMLIISYGLLVGVFYAISTVLNQMIALKSADAPVLAGRLGLVMVISGMFGSVVSGYILDKTHKFKLVNASLYLLSLLAMINFALAIEFNSKLTYYLAIILLGYFMTGYLLIGFEMSNEITWPLPESISAGLLNLSAQVFGVVLTYAGSFIVDYHGSMAANIFFICSLVVGLLVTMMIKAQMKRQSAIEIDT